MADSRFRIGQRVLVKYLDEWNGTPADIDVRIHCWRKEGVVVRPDGYDTIAVNMGQRMGVLQFLPDELEPLTE